VKIGKKEQMKTALLTGIVCAFTSLSAGTETPLGKIGERSREEIAAFFTDNYGREFVLSETVFHMDEDEELTYANRPWDYITSPGEWIF
jgi:hypothetical protein